MIVISRRAIKLEIEISSFSRRATHNVELNVTAKKCQTVIVDARCEASTITIKTPRIDIRSFLPNVKNGGAMTFIIYYSVNWSYQRFTLHHEMIQMYLHFSSLKNYIIRNLRCNIIKDIFANKIHSIPDLPYICR